MKIIFSIFFMCFLLCCETYAKENKFIIVAQRSSSIGLEQSSIVVSNNGEIQLISNSNFLTPSYPYHYGLFKIPDSKSILRRIKSIENATGVSKGSPLFFSEHDLTLFIDGEKTPINTKRYRLAISLLKDVLNQKTLQTKDGFRIQSKEDFSKIQCQNDFARGVCTFKYGYIRY